MLYPPKVKSLSDHEYVKLFSFAATFHFCARAVITFRAGEHAWFILAWDILCFLSISKLIFVYASLSEVVQDITYLRRNVFFFQSSEVVCERFGWRSISTNRRSGLLISTAGQRSGL